MDQSLGKQDLSSFWSDKTLRSYIQEQIAQACFEVDSIGQHYVVLTYRFNASFNPNLEDHVMFMIVLGKRFPVTAPQVFIASTFVQPSLKSYADFLKIILGGDWSLTLKLKDITLALPLFILKIQREEDFIAFAQKNSQYHSQKVYSYSLLKRLSDSGPYIAFETGEQDSVKLYIISVTASHFVLFRPNKQPTFKNNKLVIPTEKQVESMSIQFIGQLQSLLQITHIREEKNQYFFTFVGQLQNNSEVKVYRKKLKITKSTQMLKLLIKGFKTFKGKIDFRCGQEQKKTEELQLLKEVKIQEHKLKNKFNKSSIIELNKTYQKLVEMYESMGLPYEEIYLRKVGILFNRPDVKLVMEQPSPQKSQTSSLSSGSSPSQSPLTLSPKAPEKTQNK